MVSAYKVNCMIIGSCNLYAKLISIATSIVVIFIIMDKQFISISISFGNLQSVITTLGYI